MAIQTINTTDVVRTTGLTKINSNFTDLDTTKLDNSLTKTQFNTALSDDNFAFLGANNVFTSTGNTSFTGKVGIGTTSPGEKLEVYAPTYPFLMFKNTSTTSGFRVGYEAATGAFIDNLENTPIIFRTNGGAERMRVSSDGNVGINTATPGEKLHINGGLRIGTTTNNVAGNMRWNGTKFQGYTGSAWVDFH